MKTLFTSLLAGLALTSSPALAQDCDDCGITADNVDDLFFVDPNVSGGLSAADLVVFLQAHFALGEPATMTLDDWNDAVPQVGWAVRNAAADYFLLTGVDAISIPDMVDCLRTVLLGTCPEPFEVTCDNCGITADNIDDLWFVDPNVSGGLTTADLVVFTQAHFALGEPTTMTLDDWNDTVPQLGWAIRNAAADYFLLTGTDSINILDMVECLRTVLLGSCPEAPEPFEVTCDNCGITADNVDDLFYVDPNLSGGLTAADLAMFMQAHVALGEPATMTLDDWNDTVPQLGWALRNAAADYFILTGVDAISIPDMVECLRTVLLGSCPEPFVVNCDNCGITADNVDDLFYVDPNISGGLSAADLVMFMQAHVALGEPTTMTLDDWNNTVPQLGWALRNAAADYFLLTGVDAISIPDMVDCLRLVLLGVCDDGTPTPSPEPVRFEVRRR